MEEIFKLTGKVHIQLIDETGKVKQEHTDHNLIVTAGKNYLMSWLAASSQAGKFMSYIAAGNSAIVSTSGMTTLASEITGTGNSRVLGTLTSNVNTWNNTASFLPGNCTGTISEVGLFSASSNGTMFSRYVPVSPYIKSSLDTLIVSWTLTIN
jgi:hypothetical protein